MVRRKGLGAGKGKGYKNILPTDKKVHAQSARGVKQPQRVPAVNFMHKGKSLAGVSQKFDKIIGEKLPKPTSTFRGRYYTSGKGMQYVRTWDVKDDGADGVIELTTAKMPDGEKWYEVRLRNHMWDSGIWTGKDYDTKEQAEMAVKIGMVALKKMKSQKMPFSKLLENTFKDVQRKEIDLVLKAMPKER